MIPDGARLCFQEDDRPRAARERGEADPAAGLRCPAIDPDLSWCHHHHQQRL